MIMYPAYSKIQEDPGDVKRVMLKAIKYISVVIIPFSFGMFIFAPDILQIIFGEKWLPATGVLRILAFVGMFRSLGSAIWPVFIARGKSKADFQVSLAQVGFFFVLVVPLAVKFQLIGVGYAVLLATIISFIIGIIRVKNILHIRAMSLFDAIKPALLCSLVMTSIVLITKHLAVLKEMNYGFLIYGFLATISYIVTTYLMNRNIIRDIKEVLM